VLGGVVDLDGGHGGHGLTSSAVHVYSLYSPHSVE
jgi:hypothetical protein